MRASTKLNVLFAGLLALAGPAGAQGAGLVAHDFDLSQFSTPLTIDNPYWPLQPGTRFLYFEVSDGECVVNEFLVTSDTKQDFRGAYAGLVARIVLDREWLDEDCDGGRDRPLESTFDWYAQDNSGNVWYFGEDTIEYLYDDQGNLLGTSREGSWEAGVGGAVAGLIMLAHPSPGAFYQQEFLADVAEDAAKVIGSDRKISIGLGDFAPCIVTKEWTPLERGAIEHKHYCAGVGLLLVDKLGGKPAVAEAIEIDLP